jgi:hypothetical protein
MSADSPVDAGSWMVDGSVFFRTQGGDLYEVGYDRSGITTIHFSPSAGLFLSKGFMLGGQVGYERVSQGGWSETTWSFGPVAGVYIPLSRFDTDRNVNSFWYFRAFYTRTQSLNRFYAPEWEVPFRVEDNMNTFGAQTGALLMISKNAGLNCALRAYGDDWHSQWGFTFEAGVGMAIVLW